MRGNAKTGDIEPKGAKQAVRAGSSRKNADAAEHRAKLMEIGRKYTLHLRVIDTAGNEVLNLTKLTLGRDSHDEENSIPEILDVLELLVEAAEEHVLPFE
jgi:hypothetical protein